jgi:methylated-DNA-[protein]-cysteine S-methyltransferase
MNFFNDVYKLCKEIPRGKVSSYKIIAEKLNTKSYQLVGYALKNNPEPRKIPCHRVVDSKGNLRGFFGDTGKRALDKKARLLEKEGVQIKDNKIVDFERLLHNF